MATVVLVGLICIIFEMYNDECSVFGDTNIEFVSRLRLENITCILKQINITSVSKSLSLLVKFYLRKD